MGDNIESFSSYLLFCLAIARQNPGNYRGRWLSMLFKIKFCSSSMAFIYLHVIFRDHNKDLAKQISCLIIGSNQ